MPHYVPAGALRGSGFADGSVSRDASGSERFPPMILALLGIDHERLSFYHNGIERRLTDVHGHVIKNLLA